MVNDPERNFHWNISSIPFRSGIMTPPWLWRFGEEPSESLRPYATGHRNSLKSWWNCTARISVLWVNVWKLLICKCSTTLSLLLYKGFHGLKGCSQKEASCLVQRDLVGWLTVPSKASVSRSWCHSMFPWFMKYLHVSGEYQACECQASRT